MGGVRGFGGSGVGGSGGVSWGEGESQRHKKRGKARKKKHP